MGRMKEFLEPGPLLDPVTDEQAPRKDKLQAKKMLDLVMLSNLMLMLFKQLHQCTKMKRMSLKQMLLLLPKMTFAPTPSSITKQKLSTTSVVLAKGIPM